VTLDPFPSLFLPLPPSPCSMYMSLVSLDAIHRGTVTNQTWLRMSGVFGAWDGPIRLPEHGKRNILITSALPYVNNVPHLGNIIGCVLSADVYARFCRLRGYNVLYICGTDEYGTATEFKAQQLGISPKELCDRFHPIHRDVYRWFDISFDHFGRTSTPIQTEITQDIFSRCSERGLISEDLSVEQLYCQTCSRFLADRYVLGTCPHCGYDDARGDQCDLCGQLLNSTELKAPRCAICSHTPINKTSRHLFLDLPKVQERLEKYIHESSEKGKWSANSLAMSLAWLRLGLKSRCITRDLKWGTPVPRAGYEDKVFYVWFDAPIGYLSITADYCQSRGSEKGWELWWKSHRPDNPPVELYQFMGKDNVTFHTVIFPCTLIGADDGYTLLHHISTTEYLNYETGKFSKSRGIGVFGDHCAESGIPVEVWRYYLLSNRPEQSDTVFTWDDLAAKTNSELNKNLGNFVNRILKFIDKDFGRAIQNIIFNDEDRKFLGEFWILASLKLTDSVEEKLQEYIESMEEVKLKNGLKTVMAVSSLGNQYFQHNKPWESVSSEDTKPRAGTVTAVGANVVLLLATLVEPFMPSVCQKILHQLQLDRSHLSLEKGQWMKIPEGHVIGVPEPIFSALSPDLVLELTRLN